MNNNDAENRDGTFKWKDGKRLAYRPGEKEYLEVNDVTEQWKKDSEGYSPSIEDRQAFYKHRIKLVEASEGSEELKAELLHGLRQSIEGQGPTVESEATSPEQPPKPNGVGFGAYYRDGTLGFINSSALFVSMVSIPTIGNAQNMWLYLTSTNRSPKGVEAYLAYKQQNSPMFRVFDWSKPVDEQFALSRPFKWMNDYLIPYQAGSENYQTVFVLNSTRRMAGAGTRWTNEVMLHNSKVNRYDLVYTHEYDLAVMDEHKYLGWGPIVETFHPFPFSINKVGFFDAQLSQDGAPPRFLTNDITELKSDHPGYEVDLKVPNSSFIVRW